MDSVKRTQELDRHFLEMFLRSLEDYSEEGYFISDKTHGTGKSKSIGDERFWAKPEYQE